MGNIYIGETPRTGAHAGEAWWPTPTCARWSARMHGSLARAWAFPRWSDRRARICGVSSEEGGKVIPRLQLGTGGVLHALHDG